MTLKQDSFYDSVVGHAQINLALYDDLQIKSYFEKAEESICDGEILSLTIGKYCIFLNSLLFFFSIKKSGYIRSNVSQF